MESFQMNFEIMSFNPPCKNDSLEVGCNGFKYKKYHLYHGASPNTGAFLYERHCTKSGHLGIRFGQETLLVTPAELFEFGEWLMKQFAPSVGSYQVEEDLCLPYFCQSTYPWDVNE
jgi:hypothetical protein